MTRVKDRYDFFPFSGKNIYSFLEYINLSKKTLDKGYFKFGGASKRFTFGDLLAYAKTLYKMGAEGQKIMAILDQRHHELYKHVFRVMRFQPREARHKSSYFDPILAEVFHTKGTPKYMVRDDLLLNMSDMIFGDSRFFKESSEGLRKDVAYLLDVDVENLTDEEFVNNIIRAHNARTPIGQEITVTKDIEFLCEEIKDTVKICGNPKRNRINNFIDEKVRWFSDIERNNLINNVSDIEPLSNLDKNDMYCTHDRAMDLFADAGDPDAHKTKTKIKEKTMKEENKITVVEVVDVTEQPKPKIADSIKGAVKDTSDVVREAATLCGAVSGLTALVINVYNKARGKSVNSTTELSNAIWNLGSKDYYTITNNQVDIIPKLDALSGWLESKEITDYCDGRFGKDADGEILITKSKPMKDNFTGLNACNNLKVYSENVLGLKIKNACDPLAFVGDHPIFCSDRHARQFLRKYRSIAGYQQRKGASMAIVENINEAINETKGYFSFVKNPVVLIGGIIAVASGVALNLPFFKNGGTLWNVVSQFPWIIKILTIFKRRPIVTEASDLLFNAHPMAACVGYSPLVAFGVTMAAKLTFSSLLSFYGNGILKAILLPLRACKWVYTSGTWVCSGLVNKFPSLMKLAKPLKILATPLKVVSNISDSITKVISTCAAKVVDAGIVVAKVAGKAIVTVAKAAGGVIASVAKAAGKVILSAAKVIGSGIVSGVKSVGSGIAKVAGKVGGFFKGLFSKSI